MILPPAWQNPIRGRPGRHRRRQTRWTAVPRSSRYAGTYSRPRHQCIQVRPSRSCGPPSGSTGKQSVEFVETRREVGILKCSVFSSGRLSTDGIGIHLQHIRQSLGPLSPSLQTHGRHQLPRPCQPFASPPAPQVVYRDVEGFSTQTKKVTVPGTAL